MSRATPLLREFAERLIAYEQKGNKSPTAKVPAAFQICEKLRPHLATLLGRTGVSALLGRALALTGAEVPGTRALELQADGSLAGVNGAEPTMNSDLLGGGRTSSISSPRATRAGGRAADSASG